MNRLIVFSLIALISGCSVSVDEQCRTWRAQGEMFSSLQTCVSCAEAIGIEDLNAVRACTFTRDTESVLKR